jgi:predicted DNA-binding transcriptional regulator YafY
MNPRERTLRLLLRLLAGPYRHTRSDLAQFFGVSKDTIKDDFKQLYNAGLDWEKNEHYRYAILIDPQFKELEYLQPLTDSDKNLLNSALKGLPGKDQVFLKKKLSSLYDFQQLGLRALRKPAIERIDRLVAAQKDQKQVVLENYRSRSSNSVRNRRVEPFHVDPEKDTLQAFDLDVKDSRHFRLSRIDRVHITDQDWQYQNHHRTKITDVFRIADNQQVFVHLQVDVSGYNSLIEEFPLALTYLEPASTPATWDFQCQVNHDFKGLINYIMGNAAHVEILAPATLKARVRAEAEEILKKIEKY